MQGDEATHLYVLTSGQVKLMQSNPNGQQVNLRTIHPWQMFGALGVVRKEATYPVTPKTFRLFIDVAETVLFDLIVCRAL